MPCVNCDTPTDLGQDVCPKCYRDPAINNCEGCGKHLEGIEHPYVCGECVRSGYQPK